MVPTRQDREIHLIAQQWRILIRMTNVVGAIQIGIGSVHLPFSRQTRPTFYGRCVASRHGHALQCRCESAWIFVRVYVYICVCVRVHTHLCVCTPPHARMHACLLQMHVFAMHDKTHTGYNQRTERDARQASEKSIAIDMLHKTPFNCV